MTEAFQAPRPDSTVPGANTVAPVPQTATMPDEALHAQHSWSIVRKYGLRSLVRDAFVRFRYADGFSHSRGLALQLSLAVIPLAIAVVGLSSVLGTGSLGSVLRQTLVALNPGGSDGAVLATLPGTSRQEEGAGSALALCLGLAVAVAALTTAMGQIERGANRIYGLQTDRPTVVKYRRALLVALVAGLPAMVGSLVLASVNGVGDAVEEVYALDDDVVAVVGLPLGVLLLLSSIAVLLRVSPRRTQPGWSWIAFGCGTALASWLVLTGLLAGYVEVSRSFGAVYGPLTGIMALLLWTQLTSIALFFAFSVTAQLEAARPRVLASPAPDRCGRPGSGAV